MTTDSSCFSKLRHAGIAQFHYYFCFSKAASFISALVFSHSLVQHAVVAVLIDIITKNWNAYKHLPTAAATVNLIDGFSALMMIVFAHISDARTGHFKMVALSTPVYLLGLVLLWFEDNFLAECSSVWILLVPGGPAFLIALGLAGRDQSLKLSLWYQLWNKEQYSDIDEKRVEARTQVWWCFPWFVGATVVFFTLSDHDNSNSAEKSFLVSAIVMGPAYILFLCGNTVYYKPTASPHKTAVYRVFKAAILKRRLNYPLRASQYYRNNRDQLPLSPDIPFFRWLDKAAIVESSSLSPEEQEKKGTLCSVTRVKDVKRVLKLVPMWIPFLTYGLVGATGTTFFIAQSSYLDDKFFKFKTPIVFLFVVKTFSRFIISSGYESLIPERWSEAKQKHLVRIGIGLVCAIVSCITAWRVEVRRLNLVEIYVDPEDDNYKPIPMSIFRLVPQFCLLGLMEGLVEDGLLEFFYDQVPKSMERYGNLLNNFILGIGYFLNILLVSTIFRSWFGDTINESRLDKYYLMVAISACVNLCIYSYVSCKYAYKEATLEEVESDEILEDRVTDL